ncbi:MAG: hypothetical protein JSW59_04690 [Phycisphaerales bacterium]|nr:MAG: hypothetical protein JSW59_04690 [Phycisphaerales bacterium]
MEFWYGISGEWIFLLNPALWLLLLHPAILFFVLRRRVSLVLLIFLICVTSPLLSWILTFLYYSCVELIAELLVDSVTGEYIMYHQPDGPADIMLFLYGWVPSIFLVPFWLAVLLLASLWWKAVKVLRGRGTYGNAKCAQFSGSSGTTPH